MLAALKAGQLLQVVWVSLLAGVGVTIIYSVVVLGGARGAEARRAGHRGGALAYGALAVGAMLVFAAGVVIGLQIMLAK